MERFPAGSVSILLMYTEHLPLQIWAVVELGMCSVSRDMVEGALEGHWRADIERVELLILEMVRYT
jgi:hypothetical protein